MSSHDTQYARLQEDGISNGSAQGGPPLPLRSNSATAVQHGLKSVMDLHSEVLRGVALPDLLAGRAQLFAAGGAAAREDPVGTFAKSQPVPWLSFFVSHSWQTPRFAKYTALLFHFNIVPTCIISCLAMLSLFYWQLVFPQFLPDAAVIPSLNQQDFTTIQQPVLCEVLGLPTFFCILATIHRIVHADTTLFLDIACINQLDAEAKSAGIRSLGAILDRSQKMIVLMDEIYWTRLWCVYEIASFCYRTGSKRMEIIPLHVPLIEGVWFVIAATFQCFQIFLAYAVTKFGVYANLIFYVSLFFGIWGNIALLLWASDHAQKTRDAAQALLHFSLEDAKCFSDTDRVAILDVIGDWFTDHGSGEKDPVRLRQLGLYNFESFVRRDLAMQIASSSGGKGAYPARSIFVIGFLMYVPQCLDVISSPDMSVWASVAMVVSGFLGAFVIIPLCSISLHLSTLILNHLRQRCGTAIGYMVASFFGNVLLFAAANIPMVVLYPNTFLDPEWRYPDDGFDAYSRKMMKMHLVVLLASIGLGCVHVGKG